MINAARTDFDAISNTPKVAVGAQIKLQQSEQQTRKPIRVETPTATKQETTVYNFVGIAG